MRPLRELQTRIESGEAQHDFFEKSSPPEPEHETQRMVSLLSSFRKRLDDQRSGVFVSAPGRTELAGNHTDHNRGSVLAGACNLDTLGVISPRNDGIIRILSAGYDSVIKIDTHELGIQPTERGSSEALVRGVAAFFADRDLQVGGFDASLESRVLPGSGLSSSAAFEVFIGTALNALYNRNEAGILDIAKAGQFAENEYFGKPCGLMDQIACAHGGIVAIDFSCDPPEIDSVQTDFREAGYSLFVIDTGGDHADLTDDYASVPEEMRSVAEGLGHTLLGESSLEAFRTTLPNLRKRCSDRALLRALHFFRDNERVSQMVSALRAKQIKKYLELVNDSGLSSATNLQNYFSPRRPDTQGISLACALGSDYFVTNRIGGAVRVHGGGFAGTVQAYVPTDHAEGFSECMEAVFGTGSVIELRIREAGPVVFS